jgi:predicted nucleic acid-binding protein
MARSKKIANVKSLVIDASVVTRWYIKEEWTDYALQLRTDYQNGKIRLIAPSLIFYEVGNVLRYCKDLTQNDIIDSLKTLLKLQISLVQFNEDLIGRITSIAFLNNITIYDSCYCAIAEEYGYKFVTADERLKNKMDKSYILHLATYDLTKI